MHSKSLGFELKTTRIPSEFIWDPIGYSHWHLLGIVGPVFAILASHRVSVGNRWLRLAFYWLSSGVHWGIVEFPWPIFFRILANIGFHRETIGFHWHSVGIPLGSIGNPLGIHWGCLICHAGPIYWDSLEIVGNF